VLAGPSVHWDGATVPRKLLLGGNVVGHGLEREQRHDLEERQIIEEDPVEATPVGSSKCLGAEDGGTLRGRLGAGILEEKLDEVGRGPDAQGHLTHRGPVESPQEEFPFPDRQLENDTREEERGDQVADGTAEDELGVIQAEDHVCHLDQVNGGYQMHDLEDLVRLVFGNWEFDLDFQPC